jgi:hypothetical protein
MSFTTNCPKCNGTVWEIKTVDPMGGNYKQSVLQCVSCGVPVGVLDYYNLGSLLKTQEKEIAELKQIAQHQSSTLSWIQSALTNLARR